MLHELLFKNPVFNEGLNVTVRNGDKWMKVNIGDELLIKETGKDEVITKGTVVMRALYAAHLIPERLLANEHDPSCRSLAGLLAEMKRVYSDFTEDSPVTVILFTL
ncbi:MAG: hypothetical protein HYT37_00875 [Candidatus Sungbacteria bacterium]|nr:hypothetical protein [Candidatus Sungbacteria bacterium]